jgi:hypothetical protein
LLGNGFGYHGITGVSGKTQIWTAVLEPLKAVISIRFSGSYERRGICQTEECPRVEAGSNKSTVTLRVVEGDEKPQMGALFQGRLAD